MGIFKDLYHIYRQSADPKWQSPDWKEGNIYYDIVNADDAAFEKYTRVNATQEREEEKKRIKDLEERLDSEEKRGGGFFAGLLGGYIGERYFGRHR